MEMPWKKSVGSLPRKLAREWKPSSIDDLFQLLFSTYGYFLFRGQADATWTLASRLERAFPDQTGINERRMMQIFQADAHMLTSYTPSKSARLEWLAMAQHHGGPTRLLDWSQSPFIALFFACCDEVDRDGAIWILDPAWAMRSSRYAFREETRKTPPNHLADAALSEDVPILVPLVTRPRFPRLVAQAGQFTLVAGSHASVMESLIRMSETPIESSADPGIPLRKVRIAAEGKESILDRLAAMQITFATVYPDIEGLARSLPHREWLDWSSDDAAN